jgi:hypothetical protein
MNEWTTTVEKKGDWEARRGVKCEIFQEETLEQSRTAEETTVSILRASVHAPNSEVSLAKALASVRRTFRIVWRSKVFWGMGSRRVSGQDDFLGGKGSGTKIGNLGYTTGKYLAFT